MNNISLEIAKQIKLFNRVEKKYECTLEQFYLILNNISNYYIVSDNDNTELKYSSTYFDTTNLVMWNAHHNNEKHRQKIRIREYANKEKYLEIKEKNIDGITRKTRIPVDSYKINDEINWISKNLIYDTKDLKKVLTIQYNRITLIHKDKLERITIDKNITFINHQTNITKEIPNIIIEVKQSYNHKSEFEELLQSLDINEIKFSKYHQGILMTQEDLN